MRIALIDAFPNLGLKEDLEFFACFHIAAARLGHESRTVVTSDDVIDYDPGLVVVTSSYSPKLWDFPTIGLLSSPLPFPTGDAQRARAILSWDGYLVGSNRARSYAEDVQIGLGVAKPIGRTVFPPTVCGATVSAFPRSDLLSICHVGGHGGGDLPDEALGRLVESGSTYLYGRSSGSHAGSGPYDLLPFDGRSVPAAMARHGVALCLHGAQQRYDDVPSMHLFAALSVGAIVICDRLDFVTRHLEDIAYIVDVDDEPAMVAERIRRILDEVNGDRPTAMERAARGRHWFEDSWSLEHQIERELLPLHDAVRQIGLFRSRAPDKPRLWPWLRSKRREPQVDVVVRTGGRDMALLKRALNSLRAADSSDLPLRVIVTDWEGRPDVVALCAQERGTGLSVRYVRSPRTGWRSTAMWDGLRAATAPLVAMMDDDDTIYANHFRQLAATLSGSSQANVAYTGVVRFEEEGDFVFAPNFAGERRRAIAEYRELKFLETFNLSRLARYDNYIQSNAWMARRPFLHAVLGDDPQLVVTEDMYLLLLLAAGGALAFTGGATAVWHWRSRTAGNSMLNVPAKVWADSARRMTRMLRNIPFAANLTFAQLAAIEPDTPAPTGVTGRGAKLGAGIGTALMGGAVFGKGVTLVNFHPDEREGAWTSAETAWADIRPADELRSGGGSLVLLLMVIPPDDGGQGWFDVGVEGGGRVRRSIATAGWWHITLPLPPRKEGSYRLTLRVSGLLPAGSVIAESRHLGMYVRSLQVTADGRAGAEASARLVKTLLP